MKKSFLILAMILCTITMFMTSCRDKAKDAAAVASGEMVYMCPMDCEKGKYYDNPDQRCPVCGMKLKLVPKPKGEVTAYKMNFSSNPTSIEAGKPATFSFTPSIVGKDGEAVALDVQHEKKIHLIVVSKDLSYFEHIHPEYQADGSYKINVIAKDQKYKIGVGHDEVKFTNGGEYTLFADYLPSGGTHQVEKINVNVTGNPAKEVSMTSTRLQGASGEYKVTLVPDSNIMKAGAPIHLSGIVTDKSGKEVDPASIENYLGAKAHMVVVSLNDKEYLHVHPEVVGGKFDLNTTFAKSGMYKGWIQFQIKGIVHTVDFTFKVD
jgi:hypothetical protein